jgi:gliding motility-associated-like protein
MNRQNYIKYLIFSFFLFLSWGVKSQITILNPGISFTQACASPSFNTYNFSFSFFPVQNLGPGNQFIVELSDGTGNFDNPVIVKTLTNTTSPVSSNFQLPVNAYGDAYRIRIRSTNPVKVSNPSNAFAAYYAVHNQPFSINNNVGSVSLCEGGSYTLQIDNNASSPLAYPQLNYIWYKNFIEIPGQTGPSLTVNEPGSYYVTVDYGPCVLNSYSNIVQVQVLPSLGPVISTDDNTTILCPDSFKTLTSNIQNSTYSYTWYRDDILIPGATSSAYQATQEGVYHLSISNGACSFESNAIALDLTDFDAAIDPDTQTIIIPGETVSLTAITDAQNPTYQWNRNNTAITGATQATYTATLAGTYMVAISQTSPCAVVKERQVTLVYPSAFTLAIQPAAAYTACSSTSVTLQVSQFDAVTPSGPVNLIGNSYGYAYQWYRNNTAVTGATSPQLTLDTATQNGSYTLKVTIPDFGEVTSNAFTAGLPLEDVTVTGDTILCEGGTVTLEASLTGAAYTYQWYEGNTAIAGATGAAHTANAEGSYYVVVTSGSCTKQSNTIVVETPEITVSSTTPPTDVILPGGTKTIAVTTNAQAPVYTWFRNNVQISETSATLTATQDGTYKVVVTQSAGCNATAEKTFVLQYPSAFNISIAANTGYQACASATATLNITAFTATTTQGPVDVTSMGYAYQWYKTNVPVTGATSSTITVNSTAQNGLYRLGVTIPSFGTVFSNTVSVQLPVPDVTITGSTQLCEGGNTILTASVTGSGYTYQWYKDTSAITGANSATYTAVAEGSYYVIVTAGSCTKQSNTLVIDTPEITVTTTLPQTMIILPGETKTLTVTTNAQAPAYAWYKNNVLISGAATSAYTATQSGTYKVVVTQTAGCNATAELIFTLQYPSAFTIAVATGTGYEACISSTAALAVTSFMASTPQGNIDVSASGYAYQWYKNDEVVAGAVSSTLNINNASQNGDYKIGVTIPEFGLVFSNTVTVQLGIEDVTISSNGVLCEGQDVVLSADVNNNNYTYQWYKNNNAISGATSASYTANAEGNYHLVIASGTCTKQSNTIALAVAQTSVSSTSPQTDFILPGETKTITVTTNAQSPAFTWFRNNVQLTETSATLTATQDGIYKVVVTQTAGCNATAESTFTLQYPSAFTIAVATGTGYEACISSTASLAVTSFMAATPQGNIDVSASGYTYQWYKNDEVVAGAVSSTLNINDATQNGDYKIGVTIPEFGLIFSNTVTVQLGIEDVTISSNGVLCEGQDVVLSADVNSTAYSYQWYKDNVAITSATQAAYTANAEGNYNVTITSGGCTKQSNTVALTIAQITVNSTSAQTDVILPGDTKIITVSTNAQAPVYTWYRNDVQLAETSATLTATEDGTYKVVLTQTQGCSASAEKTFILQYPTGFNLTIAVNASYQACVSGTATLNAASFTASTPQGNINVTALGYPLQWYRNNEPVEGATVTNLTVNNASQNGDYKLGVSVPGFGIVFSNSISINLAIEPVVITAGQLCPTAPSVAITSNTTTTDYTYTWFKDGAEVSTGSAAYTATQTGDYYVVVNTGACSFTSNTVTISESTITVSSATPATDVIIPGETKTLSVTTDAQQPEYQWYRDNVLITGADSATYAATQDGEYKVVVTQTQGCELSEEITFTLAYPSAFEIVIAPAADYQACSSTATTVSVTSITAITPNGPVTVSGSTYAYQWFNGTATVPGGTAPTLAVSENGNYTVQVTVSDWGIATSNTVAIQLGFADGVTITSEGSLCEDGATVTLSSSLTDPLYTYTWHIEDNSATIGSTPELAVQAEGSYYLEVSYNGCTLTSNTINVAPADLSAIVIDIAPLVELPEGTTLTLEASGAETYSWYQEGSLIATTPSVEITEQGNYSITAAIGPCEVTKSFMVKVVENEVIAIPNVVTPNNDGINDKWALPQEYVADDIEITIYDPTGKVVFKRFSYTGTWPESDFTWSLKNPVYYYTISKNYEIIRRGSITILK